jgi:hypothetical protein
MSMQSVAGGSAPAAISWRVSSFCAGNGECVAVGQLASGHVLVTDTKVADGPRLRFDAREWAAFLAGVRAGEFD